MKTLEDKAEDFLTQNNLEDLILGFNEKGEYVYVVQMMAAFAEKLTSTSKDQSKKGCQCNSTSVGPTFRINGEVICGRCQRQIY